MYVVCWENYESSWKYEADCKKMKKTMDKKNVKYKATLYTSAKKGQNKFGGWTPEGRDQYSELRDVIAKARRERHASRVEEQARMRCYMKRKMHIRDLAREQKGIKQVEPKDDLTRAAVGFKPKRNLKNVVLDLDCSDDEAEAEVEEVAAVAAVAAGELPANQEQVTQEANNAEVAP